MFTFGKKSQEKINTCHKDLQLIFKESLKVSMVDFGVSEGNRSLKKQKEYFDKGLSKIDGVNRKGKHNYTPSMAGDIYAYVKNKPGHAYDLNYLLYLGGVITSTAKRLLNEGKVTHKLRWGANFDRDNEILEQAFDDAPHYELED